MLHRLGVLAPVERAYFNLKTASPDVVRREFRLSSGVDGDGVPVPPSGLVFDVIACRWRAVYLDSGALIVDDMVETLRQAGVEPGSLGAVLDFGCGCGRLIRHLRNHTKAELFGSDYNPELVAWCSANLDFAEFSNNTLAPPLAYPDATFDYVYARSVFTHLEAELFREWVEEMGRIIRPGGILYVTMHGEQLAQGLSAADRAAFDADKLVVTYASLAGENLCSTFATQACTEQAFGSLFEPLAFRAGRPQTHLRQDVYLFSRRS